MTEARGMLTVNTDLKDRLVVNGQLGTVKHVSQDSIDSVIKIYFTLSWTEKDERMITFLNNIFYCQQKKRK